MTGAGDLVAESCGQLAAYMAVLEREVAELARRADAGSTGYISVRVAETPEPWDGQAGRALMDALEGIRRLKARLIFEKTGHPGVRHHMSDGNTAIVLEAIPKLAAGFGDAGEDFAFRVLDKWIRAARAHPAIDLERRWRALPCRDDGTGRARPRSCPYCGMYELRADRDARPMVVQCQFPGCRDHAGNWPPTATLGTDGHGRPVLAWADGTVEVVPEMDEPARTGGPGPETAGG